MSNSGRFSSKDHRLDHADKGTLIAVGLLGDHIVKIVLEEEREMGGEKRTGEICDGSVMLTGPQTLIEHVCGDILKVSQ